MHVRWRAGAGVELVLTVQAVLDPVRISAERRRGEWGPHIAPRMIRMEGLTGEAQIGRCVRSLIALYRALATLPHPAWSGFCSRLHPRVGGIR